MALDFDGSTQYISAGYSPITAPPLSIACWFNADTLTDATVFGLGSSSNGDALVLQSWSDGVLYLTINKTGTSEFATSTGTYSTGVWTSAVGTMAADGTLTVYRAGGNSGASASTVVWTAINRVSIGRKLIGGGADPQFFDGKLGVHGAWNVELTAAEAARFNAGDSPTLIRPSALKFCAPLIRNGEINLYGPALTVTGGPTAFVHPRIRERSRSQMAYAASAGGGGGSSTAAAIQANVLMGV